MGSSSRSSSRSSLRVGTWSPPSEPPCSPRDGRHGQRATSVSTAPVESGRSCRSTAAVHGRLSLFLLITRNTHRVAVASWVCDQPSVSSCNVQGVVGAGESDRARAKVTSRLFRGGHQVGRISSPNGFSCPLMSPRETSRCRRFRRCRLPTLSVARRPRCSWLSSSPPRRTGASRGLFCRRHPRRRPGDDCPGGDARRLGGHRAPAAIHPREPVWAAAQALSSPGGHPPPGPAESDPSA